MNSLKRFFYWYVNIVFLKRYLCSVHHKQKVTTFGNFDKLHRFCKWLFCKKWECCLVLILSGCECCDLRISIFKDCQQAARAIKNYDLKFKLKSGYFIKNMVSLINSSFSRYHSHEDIFSAAIFWDGLDFMRERGLVIKMSVKYIALRQLNYQIIGIFLCHTVL